MAFATFGIGGTSLKSARGMGNWGFVNHRFLPGEEEERRKGPNREEKERRTKGKTIGPIKKEGEEERRIESPTSSTGREQKEIKEKRMA
ncbi:hypothetical protein NC651_031340 [Populus alba x Populus x berolinensis]|nr:hypothetical protein NC651_031340 [Populus alba x Populus x berolinensis]